MKPKSLLLSAFLALSVLAGCTTTPYTNRKQFMMYSESSEDDMGAQAYAEILKKAKLSTDAEAAAMVRRAGDRIAKVSDKPSYKWEFNLIDEPKTVNAFCLPGGRVAFYTGILPITKDETGVAVVMGHEIAHALARHGGERMSSESLKQAAEEIAVQTGVIKSAGILQAVELAYGVGVGLPHSRSQESEADRIGLILMAKAGYDPRAAVGFWERMAAAKGGGSPPEFLSTHPSDKRRIDDIKGLLPEALKYYKP